MTTPQTKCCSCELPSIQDGYCIDCGKRVSPETLEKWGHHPSPAQDWSEEFEEKFGIYSRYADVCPSKETYMDFISRIIAQTDNEAYNRGYEAARQGKVREMHDSAEGKS